MLIYLVAGEPSGDMLGARLMHAMKKLAPETEFAGVGGENMEKEGLTSLFDITDLAVMGLAEVIPSIPKVLRHIKETVEDIAAKKPDVVVTIDSWSFSERVHKALRKKGIKVLQMHYVAPQVWAWKKGRAKTMYKYIDRLLTLFPNEPAYFTPHHLEADCVGHPVIENPLISGELQPSGNIDTKDKRLILILPGSRHNEVEKLLPTFVDATKELDKRYNDLLYVLPTVKTVEQRVERILTEKDVHNIQILHGREEKAEAMLKATAAIAASGTVSLELAMMKIPHIIAYKVAPLTAWLARHLLKIKSVNLPNILLDESVVPELLQEDCNAKKIADTIGNYLDNAAARREFEQKMDKLCQVMGVGELKPSEKAAKIIFATIEARHKA